MNVQELFLLHYRNFDTLHLKLTSPQIIITGDNGIGKTNILEAISFLSPGRGLRYAKLEELPKVGESNFSIDAVLQTTLGPTKIQTTYSTETGRRNTEFNGSKIAHNELANFINIVWLIPQMDGLFLGPASDRRRFLDRVCYSFAPEHAKLITQYEHYLKERIKTLESYPIDDNWLSALEEKLAIAAKDIDTNRTVALLALQDAIDNMDTSFPKAKLELIPNNKDMGIDELQSQFRASREQDTRAGRSHFGPHRSDLMVYYANKNMPAKYCSTGEQKAMLISITIAHIIAKRKVGGLSPILLLDETFVHLDETRRGYLAAFLKESDSQVWITSTEAEMSKYFANAQVIGL